MLQSTVVEEDVFLATAYISYKILRLSVHQSF